MGVLRHARILVAEDDPLLLEAVSVGLELSGAHVVEAETGGELIERLADDGPFDLIVTDISMPWMTGFQAMHSARTAGVGTPIIVITALRADDLAERVLALGHNVVLLRKPFELTDLVMTAARLLSVDRGEETQPDQTSG